MDRYLEIEQLIARSMFAQDEFDSLACAEVFSERATVYGATGPREILRLFEEANAVPGVAPRRHSFSNFRVVADDGDEVSAEHLMVLHIARGKSVEMHIVGRGVTRVVREDGQWKILNAELHLDTDYNPGDRPLQMPAGTIAGRSVDTSS